MDLNREYHVSFDVSIIRRDQKQRGNGEACRADPTCFWSSLINLISIDTYVVSISHALLAHLIQSTSILTNPLPRSFLKASPNNIPASAVLQ